jgi:lipid A disaccharide synthetase
MSYASLIEPLRAERDDLLKANALLHALIGNREAEIERLRAALKGAIEAIERGSTTAPVLECLRSALEQKSP